MAKKFNYTGTCIPGKHYMIDTSQKIESAIAMIKEGDYITINYPRQFGKTTTLLLLERELEKRGYLGISIDFQGMGDTIFSMEESFVKAFAELISDELEMHKKGMRQLSGYLKRQNVDKGYLVIFDFKKAMDYKQERVTIGGRDIFIVWV